MTVTLNMDKLKGLNRMVKMQGGHRVDVGIFSDHNARNDGETNATVGAKNEFGTAEVQFTDGQPEGRPEMTWPGIPQRSFLRMPLTTELPAALAEEASILAYSFTSGGPSFPKGLDSVLESVGFIGEAVVQEAFDSQGFGEWPDNSQRTKDWKATAPGPGGVDKPLNDTLQLRQSISSRVMKRK